MSVIRNLQFISFKDLDQISGSKQMHYKSEKDVDYLSFH